MARAIHERSKRKDRTLVKVNCASIPHELFESEFFGHVKGAFTGALRDRAGRFEVADRGTLFLDEIGEIPLPLANCSVSCRRANLNGLEKSAHAGWMFASLPRRTET